MLEKTITANVIDHNLLDAPVGFLRDAVEWGMKTAFAPNKPLTFGMALSTLATVTSGKLKTVDEISPNLQVILAGVPGTGKNRVVKQGLQILRQTGLNRLEHASFYRSEELDEAIKAVPGLLWVNDYIDIRPLGNKEPVLQRFMDVFAQGRSPVNYQAACDTGFFVKKYGNQEIFRRLIRQSLIFNAETDIEQQYGHYGDDCPESLTCTVDYWKAVSVDDPIVAGITPDAGEYHDSNASQHQNEFAGIYAKKLALLYAASYSVYGTTIDLEAMRWGWDMVKTQPQLISNDALA